MLLNPSWEIRWCMKRWGRGSWDRFPSHPCGGYWTQVRMQIPWAPCSAFFPLHRENPRLVCTNLFREPTLSFMSGGALPLRLRETYLTMSEGLIAWASQRFLNTKNQGLCKISHRKEEQSKPHNRTSKNVLCSKERGDSSVSEPLLTQSLFNNSWVLGRKLSFSEEST